MVEKRTATKTNRAPKPAAGSGTRVLLRPEVVAIGCVVAGAAAALLLPISAREKRFTAPLGRKLLAKGARVAQAARTAAANEMKSMPLSVDAAASQVSRVVDHVVEEALA